MQTFTCVKLRKFHGFGCPMRLVSELTIYTDAMLITNTHAHTVACHADTYSYTNSHSTTDSTYTYHSTHHIQYAYKHSNTSSIPSKLEPPRFLESLNVLASILCMCQNKSTSLRLVACGMYIRKYTCIVIATLVAAATWLDRDGSGITRCCCCY